jgi:hypothetical protein
MVIGSSDFVVLDKTAIYKNLERSMKYIATLMHQVA